MVKNLPANAGDPRDAGLIPGSGRSPGGGNGKPLQYSCLENPTDREAWRATVHGVAQNSDKTKQLKTHTHQWLGRQASNPGSGDAALGRGTGVLHGMWCDQEKEKPPFSLQISTLGPVDCLTLLRTDTQSGALEATRTSVRRWANQSGTTMQGLQETSPQRAFLLQVQPLFRNLEEEVRSPLNCSADDMKTQSHTLFSRTNNNSQRPCSLNTH